MGKYKDLIGQKFGKLTVIALDEERTKESLDKRRRKESTSNAIYWLCKCDCGNEKVVSGTSLKHGSTKTCGNCIIKENSIVTTNPEILEEWGYDKNICSPYSITSGTHKKIWWKCKNGHCYQTYVNNKINENIKCPYCSNKKVLTGYNDLNTVRPDLTMFLVNIKDGEKVTEHSSLRIDTQCPICGKQKNMTVSQFSRINIDRKYPCNCYSNSMSFPELYMNNVLTQLNIKFYTEKRFDWAKQYYYDFYIEDKNIIIETHGIQHYDGNGFSLFSNGVTVEQQKEIDLQKEQIAKNNGMNYIIIDCRKSDCNWIKNSILSSELSKIYDLSKIDWNNCGRSINIINSIGEKWNDGLSIQELMNYFDKDRGTILKYLKIASFSGLCDYNEQESRRRGENKKDRNKNCKKAYCVEDDKVIENIAQYARDNHFSHSKIYDCCKGKKQTYKGKHYIWLEEK